MKSNLIENAVLVFIAYIVINVITLIITYCDCTAVERSKLEVLKKFPTRYYVRIVNGTSPAPYKIEGETEFEEGGLVKHNAKKRLENLFIFYYFNVDIKNEHLQAIDDWEQDEEKFLRNWR